MVFGIGGEGEEVAGSAAGVADEACGGSRTMPQATLSTLCQTAQAGARQSVLSTTVETMMAVPGRLGKTGMTS